MDNSRREKLIRESNRGDRAKQLLEDDLIQDCLNNLTEYYNREILESAPNETEKRERAYFALKAAKLFAQQFTHMVHTGQIAKRELEKAPLSHVI